MKESKLIGLMVFLILICMLVSCKKKDPPIKTIKNIDQLTDHFTEKTPEKPPVIVKEDPPEEVEEVIEVKNKEWKSIYLDLLDYRMVQSEYGDYLLFDDKLSGIENISLYDLDGDGVPELFVEGGYESTCIYSIKEGKLVFLDEIIPGSMDIRRNLSSGKKTLFVSSLLEGDGGMYYLSTIDMESGKIIYEILFGKYFAFNEAENEYYLNVKNPGETLDDAFMDFESRQVSQEVYQREEEEYEKLDQVVEQVIPYTTPMYDEESFKTGLELFKDALEDYDMKHL